MADFSENNKRIAKNTLFLYFRMILIMGITLYTSRVILSELGVIDYGIYNLVAGVVVLFTFLNNTMTSASQRFLSVALGKNDLDYTQKVFTTCFRIHLLLSVIVLLLCETIGLWFLLYKLDIPTERLDSAIITYHIAVITTCFGVIKIPYNAAIIANEKMSFFAYTSIIDATLKLLIVFFLAWLPFDKLITYSYLLLGVNCIMVLWYYRYCKRKFSECRVYGVNDYKLIKEITTFFGWNLFGSVGDVAYKQGTSFILNIFCGVALNATMGITNQVRTAVYSFISNLQLAANPQIIKLYTIGEYEKYELLVCRISKISFYLMLLIAMPIMINVSMILKIWLVNVPQYTDIFVFLIMIFALVDSLHGPLWITMQAAGKIRNYQIVVSTCLLMNLPISYLFLNIGYEPYSIITVQIIVSIILLFVRLLFSHYMAKIRYAYYLKDVILPIIVVSAISTPSIFYICSFFDGWKLFIVSIISVLTINGLAIWILGLKSVEKKVILNYLRTKLSKL